MLLEVYIIFTCVWLHFFWCRFTFKFAVIHTNAAPPFFFWLVFYTVGRLDEIYSDIVTQVTHVGLSLPFSPGKYQCFQKVQFHVFFSPYLIWLLKLLGSVLTAKFLSIFLFTLHLMLTTMPNCSLLLQLH